MAAKTNYLGTVHIADKDTPGQQVGVTSDGRMLVTPAGSADAANGGLSTSYLAAAASTNLTVVKASPGKIYKVRAFNNGSTAVFLKMFNKTTNPTLGSDTVFDKFEILAGSAGAGFIDDTNLGQAYSVGIAYALTAGFADSDTSPIGANVVSVTILYL